MKAREGILARAIKQKKATLINAYTGGNTERVLIGDISYGSILAIPMISNGNNDGMIVMGDQKGNFFSPDDITLAEGTADRLLSAWRRSRTDQSLEELIHSGISLTTLTDLPTILSRVASIGSEVLKSHFVFVTVKYKNHLEHGHSGKYNDLLDYLIQPNNPLVSETFQTMTTIRVRDISRDARLSELLPLAGRFRSLMIAPILLHGEPIGSIMTFGKRNGLIFEERDLFLVNILANQASAAVESSMLNEDIRLNLRNTQLLYNLSTQIESAQELDQAANVILEAATQLTTAQSAGIMLFSPQRELEANLVLGKDKRNHPFSMIQQVMESQQAVFLSPSEDISIACFPLQTQRRCFGALWLEIQENVARQASHSTEELRILINQATVALERTILLAETKKQADEIARAYQELEEIYDQTLITLMSALDARDHETEGHCARVTNLAGSLGEKMKITPSEAKALERGALLHDIGKIGITDSILHKPGPLSKAEWVEMQKHPVIGAKILEAIPFLRDAIPVVAGHQERWDGSGYPLGLSQKQIPVLARIFSVADVFDALISDRPYHQKRTPQNALEYMREHSGTSFDPDVINCLDSLMADPEFLIRNGYSDAKESK
ncbi:MAG: GAF domain-containing protein [Anaerolineaceae bacterium]|nr:GAF domain-containing protein [Anaerolineaceae bacterium]